MEMRFSVTDKAHSFLKRIYCLYMPADKFLHFVQAVAVIQFFHIRGIFGFNN